MDFRDNYDAIVVGGGFFGCSLAVELKKNYKHVLLIEKEKDLLQRASYVNQARIHNGYHYPRHFLTALRSKVNFPRFIKDYKDCVASDFDKYYAVSKLFSKTTAHQFYSFMRRVGSPIEKAPANIKNMFAKELIDDVFLVKEFAFDAVKLKEIALNRILDAKVEIAFETSAHSIVKEENRLLLNLETNCREKISVKTGFVYNCTYANINYLLYNSKLPLIPLKHEIAELCLIELPDELKNMSVTVMCGPFFSFMPFPARGLTTLSHVRYTPHCYWHDQENSYQSPLKVFSNYSKNTHFPYMIRDSARYLPYLSEAKYKDSIWEVKTILPVSENDDGRPILFRKDHGLEGLTCVMGGKIDNIYDMQQEIGNMQNLMKEKANEKRYFC